ncbi:IclR family transcriptional regulator [Burkholderia sp. WSM2230]|uniref:IclR family transcriptional regulator n=1 Tax=Burkholderia sp. WSM2230 TaxID=944435 RepID=UPI0004293343|nr:IclR family transcriptional regulator [Burkholderia sp. WSM2230]
MPRPPQVTLTLERGLQMLRAFHADRVPLTNGELASRTGLSRSAVSRLTSTLVHEGFIRRIAGGPRFELATGVFGIGQAYLATNPVTRRAEPLMQKLADQLDVAVALAVPDGLDMLYIAHRCSVRISALQLGVGSLLPMDATAVGWAWLWGLPDVERSRLVARLLDAAGSRSKEVGTAIETAFDDLYSSGVCMAVGQYRRNAYGIALPVTIGRPKLAMALSCGAIDVKPDIAAIRGRVVPELKRAATELQSLLADVELRPE